MMIKVTSLCFFWVLFVPTQQAFNCPIRWESYSGKCYRFVAYPLATYQDASKTCREDGAVLLSVNSEAEHQFIATWLDTNDERKADWMTSGVVESVRLKGVRWNGDGSFSQSFQYWINQTYGTLDGESLVYSHSGNAYAWGIEQRTSKLSFICEISEDESYRIVEEDRDFDYGLATEDPNEVPRGPTVIVEPVDTTVLAKTSALFLECIAQGVPNPTYKWMRLGIDNTETIEPSSRFMLTNGKLAISNPTDNDAGRYQAKISNNQGTVLSRSIQLSFGYLGQFGSVETAPVIAGEYEGTKMECPTITARPAAHFMWYKNDITNFVRPKFQKYIFISNNGKLYFSEVNTVDEGRYHCIVTLTSLEGTGMYVGSSQNPSRSSLGFQLKINPKAAGTYQPQIQDDFIAVFPGQPKRGQRIQMECFAYGTGPLEYTWARIGKLMPKQASLSDHNRVLTIESVSMADQGEYKCRVFSTSSGQSQEKIYTLRIEGKPFFTYKLQHQHADVGAKLRWQCEANGQPYPTYTWYKNGVQMQNISGVITVRRNILTIERLNVARDSGMYQCGATNTHGTVYSTAQLRVLDFAPTFRKHPLQKLITASRDGNVTITCEPEAAPSPEYRWLKDGRDLGLSKGAESGNMRMLMNGNLFITRTQIGDQGRYTCKVVNAGGQAEDYSDLKVIEKTTITRGPSAVRVPVNSTATMTCEASANANMDMIYSWQFNGHPIKLENNPHFRLGTGFVRGNLYILNAQFIHGGTYSCNAATGLDIQSAEAALTVIGPPGEPAGIFQDINSIDVSKPRTVKLMWTPGNSHGSDVIYYDIEFKTNFDNRWRVLNQRILVRDTVDSVRPDKRSSILQNLKPGAGYNFRVRAVNAYGPGTPSIPTTTIQIPSDRPYVAPARISGGTGKIGTLTVLWQSLPLEDLNGRKPGYHVFWRLKPVGVGGDSLWNTATVYGYQANKYITDVGTDNFYTEYEVKVQAFNQHGNGNMSHIAVIRSAEILPVEVPQKVYADSYNSTALTVYWKPIPDTRKAAGGKLLGYKINYWRKGVDGERDAIQTILHGQKGRGIIIGLQPNTWYIVNVQAFNSAGNGRKSEVYPQITDRMAPQLYPTEVHVHSYSENAVRVTYRGVSTRTKEEPLQGYKIQYWPMGENIREAINIDVEKKTDVIVKDIEKGKVYQMRLFGYSRGGQGKMSSPTTLFTLGGQIRIDQSSTEILAAGSQVVPGLFVLVICVLISWQQTVLS